MTHTTKATTITTTTTEANRTSTMANVNGTSMMATIATETRKGAGIRAALAGMFALAGLLSTGCQTIPASAVGPGPHGFPDAASLETAAIDSNTAGHNANGAHNASAAGAAAQAAAATAPATATLVDEAQATALVRQALLKDAADGFRLSEEPANARKVQYAGTPLDVVESRRFDGLWSYDLLEDATHFRKLHTTVRADRNGKVFNVADSAIVRNWRASVEQNLPLPADAPAGSRAMRVGIEVLADPMPLRGAFVVDRLYQPGQGGKRDREIAQLQISRDLRFNTPSVPTLHGQALVIKRTLARFVPVPTGLTTIQARHLPITFEDVPLSMSEEQVWPGGTVIQQDAAVADNLKILAHRGTIIAGDANRSTLRFERIVDLVSGSSRTVIRTFDGFAVILVYNVNGVLVEGKLEAAGGRVVGTVTAAAGKARLALIDGATRQVSL